MQIILKIIILGTLYDFWHQRLLVDNVLKLRNRIRASIVKAILRAISSTIFINFVNKFILWIWILSFLSVLVIIINALLPSIHQNAFEACFWRLLIIIYMIILIIIFSKPIFPRRSWITLINSWFVVLKS